MRPKYLTEKKLSYLNWYSIIALRCFLLIRWGSNGCKLQGHKTSTKHGLYNCGLHLAQISVTWSAILWMASERVSSEMELSLRIEVGVRLPSKRLQSLLMCVTTVRHVIYLAYDSMRSQAGRPCGGALHSRIPLLLLSLWQPCHLVRESLTTGGRRGIDNKGRKKM